MQQNLSALGLKIVECVKANPDWTNPQVAQHLNIALGTVNCYKAVARKRGLLPKWNGVRHFRHGIRTGPKKAITRVGVVADDGEMPVYYPIYVQHPAPNGTLPVVTLPYSLGKALYMLARKSGARVAVDSKHQMYFDIRVIWIGKGNELDKESSKMMVDQNLTP